MDYFELDESLKLLNGLNNDLSKRTDVINYIKEFGRISVFAYGSLLWNPIQHFDKIISNCILRNYTKGFICQDFIYRGTTELTGLTMALENDSNGFVNGSLLISYDKQIIPFIKSFVKRETPTHFNGTQMDIYKYDFLKISLPDRNHFEYALTCVVNSSSLFYLNNQLTYEQQANQIGQAYGINGTNFQYLQKLKQIYFKLNIQDSFSSNFDYLYNKVLEYRQNLSIKDQQWFTIYDQLQTLEERQQALTTTTTTLIRNYFIDFKETNQQSEQIKST